MHAKIICVAATLLMAAPAYAASDATSTAPANPTISASPDAPSNPAVKTTEGNNPGAPAQGANSFTESQAKGRIEARGFSNVTNLMKDDQGLWHGKAMKAGKQVAVAVDYQGNVVAN